MTTATQEALKVLDDKLVSIRNIKNAIYKSILQKEGAILKTTLFKDYPKAIDSIAVKKAEIPSNSKFAYSSWDRIPSAIIDYIKNTAEINISDMFSYCSNITTEAIDVAFALNIDRMFLQCRNLKRIALKSTSRISSLQNTFNGCSILSEIFFEDGLPSATNFNFAFEGCKSLTAIIPNLYFDLNHTLCDGMYKDTGIIGSITSDSLNIIPISNRIESSSRMFLNTNIDTIGNLELNSCENCSYMFSHDSGSASVLNLVGTIKLPVCKDITGMFRGLSKLTSIESLEIPICSNLDGAFAECRNLTSVKIIGLGQSPDLININLSDIINWEKLSLEATINSLFDRKDFSKCTIKLSSNAYNAILDKISTIESKNYKIISA